MMMALAYYATHVKLPNQIDEDSIRQEIFEVIPSLAKSPSDLFLFIDYRKQFSEGHGFSRGTRSAIKKWYESKSALELAEMLGKNRSHHKWEHADVLKLAHVKFEGEDKLAVRGAVFKHATQIVKAHEAANISPALEGMNRLLNITRLKICESPADAAEMIRQHSLCIENVPVHLMMELVVWEALLPKLNYNQILQYLPFLNDNKLLKANTNFAKSLCQALGNTTLIAESKVHPLNIFLALKQHDDQKRYHESVKVK